MIGLSAIGALLFFLPGILSTLEYQIGDDKSRQRITPLATSAPEALGLIGSVSLLVHFVLVILLKLISASGLAVLDPSIIFSPTELSGTQVLLSLSYSIVSAFLGFAFGSYVRKFDANKDKPEGSINRLFQLEQSNDALDLVAFVYFSSSPKEGAPDGLVGLVSKFSRKSEGSVAWIDLVDPNPFTVQITDGIATLEEAVISRSDNAAPDAEFRPIVHLDTNEISRIVFGLYERPELARNLNTENPRNTINTGESGGGK